MYCDTKFKRQNDSLQGDYNQGMNITHIHKGQTDRQILDIKQAEQHGYASTVTHNSLGQHAAEERHDGPQVLRQRV